jgi:hypothetical protein
VLSEVGFESFVVLLVVELALVLSDDESSVILAVVLSEVGFESVFVLLVVELVLVLSDDE